MADTPYRSATGEIDFANDKTLRPVNSAPQVAERPWGYATEASLGNAGAMLANIPAAMGSQDALDFKLQHEREAQAATQLAARQGIPQAFADVEGPVDFLKYAGNLGLQSAPMLSTVVGAGLVNPLAGAAAAYGWAYGDVLGNQYEQAGKYDPASAAAAAVPYAAVDYFTGLEGRLLRGFPESTGAAWYGRAATHGATTALSEGAGETFQEFMNSAGRAAVDPNYEFFDSPSLERYKESFIGGAVLGGFGGAMAGPLRENRTPTPINQNVPTDLLNPQPVTQAMAPVVGQGELNYDAFDYGQGVNLYDVSGHVSAAEQGPPTTVDSPQGELFGTAQFQSQAPVVEQPVAPPPLQYTPPVAQPTQQSELPLPGQVGSNPYDVGGHVSALQQGQPTTVDSPQGELFGANEGPPQVGEVEIAPEDPVVTLRTNLASSLKEAFKETAGKEPSQARLKQLLQKHIGDIATPEEARAALAEAPTKYKAQAQQGTAQVVEKWKEAFDRLMPATSSPVVAQEGPIGEPQTAIPLTGEPQTQSVTAQTTPAPAPRPQASKAEEPQSSNMRELKLQKLFREAFGERNAVIARDVLEGTLTKEQIGKKHGITGQRVSQIGSQRALAEAVHAAARRMQIADAELYELLTGEQEAIETAEDVVDEAELGEREGYGTATSVGGSQSNWKDINIIGKLADEWATAKSAGDDVTAKAIEEKIKSIQHHARGVDKQQSAQDLWGSMATEDAPSFEELSPHLQDEWADSVENGHDTLADMNNIVEKHQAETTMRDGPYENIERFNNIKPQFSDHGLNDVEVEQEVQDDTGRKATVKISAREALADINERIKKAQELLACLKS